MAFQRTRQIIRALGLGSVAILMSAGIASAQITRLNLRPDGGGSGMPLTAVSSLTASDDGRYVAFISSANDLVPGAAPDAHHAYLLDRQSGVIRLVTRGHDGTPAQRAAAWGLPDVLELRISGDGSTVVFVSAFTNLVPGDTNNQVDVFAYDAASQAVARISVDANGNEVPGRGRPMALASPDVSADGSVIVYTAMEQVLSGRPDGEVATVIVNRATATTTVFPLGAPTMTGFRPGQVAVSGNGRFVAAWSDAALLPEDTNGIADIYVHDVETHAIERVSVTTAGEQSTPGGFYGSRHPSISHDGRFVVFESDSATLAPPLVPFTSVSQVFIRDRTASTTTRVSETSAGIGGGAFWHPSARISPDGKRVAFITTTPGVFSSMTFSEADALVWSRETRQVRQINIPTHMALALGSGAYVREVWPTNGHDVLFLSGQPNLVANDFNGTVDVFARSMEQPEPVITAVDPAEGPRDVDVDLTLTGTGFVGGSTMVLVRPGSVWPLPATVTPTSVSVTLPGGEGARTVVVVTPHGVAEVTFTSPTCSYTVTPGSLLIPASGGTYTLVVTPHSTTDACPWTAFPGAGPTLSIEGPASGVGPGTIQVTVAPSTVRDTRQGSLHIARERVILTQAGTTQAPVPGGQNPATVSIPTSLGPVDLTFHDVSRAAIVSAWDAPTHPTTVAPAPQAVAFTFPNIFRVGGDVEFASARMCFPYAQQALDVAGEREKNVRLFQVAWPATTWTDVTESLDAQTNRVCGNVRGVGTFFVGTIRHLNYLAEGATSAFFDMRLALLNPGDIDALAALTFTLGDGRTFTHQVPAPARHRVTIDPKSMPGLADAEFSTLVASDEPLVVDRTMTWDAAGYGAHAETAATQPSSKWYLAEGATHSGFHLFYLLQNPSDLSAVVRIRYLLPTGDPLEKMYTLAPRSRTNIWVNLEQFGHRGFALASTDVSAVIDAIDGTPIIVERAMYLSNQGRSFNAGHASTGVPAPATSWFLAEGATGDYFDLFVLIANPTDTAADVTVRYLLSDGATYSRSLVVAPNSRTTIWVDHENIEGVPGHPLADVAVSTTVTSTNGVPIIVERAMWWGEEPAGWQEAHNSAGSRDTGTLWALAEGEVGGPRNTETYILIANTSLHAGNATVTLLFEDGTSVDREYPLLPQSRTNVPVSLDFGAAVGNKRFGALVESTGAMPARIVVERAMYSDADEVQWAAGTNALATKLQ